MAENSLVWNFIARDRASKTIDAIGSKVGGLGQRIASGFGRAAEAAVIGLGAAMLRGVIGATSLQKSMERLHTQAGVSQGSIGMLTDGVLKMSGQVGISAKTLSDGLYHIESSFASTGITGQKSLELLRVAAEGARVGNADLVDVTNALDAAVVANIPGVNNLRGAMGVLNATVGAGDMSMQDLAEAMGGGVIAVVKGFGLSILDVGAALAVFGDNNIRGAEAGTQLRMAVQAMAMPVKGAKNALEQLGMTQHELAQDMQKGGLNLALQDLIAHMKKAGITSVQQGQIITELFGRKAGTGVNILVGQFERLQSKYVDLKKGSDTFGESWTALQGTFDQAKTRLLIGLDSIAIKLGMKLLPSLTKVTNYAADNLPHAFDGVQGAIARINWAGLASGASAAVAAARGELGKIDFSGIAARLASSAKSWGQSLINGIREGMRSGDWSSLGETIGKGISSAMSNIGKFLIAGVGKLGDLFGQLFEKIDWVGIGIAMGKQAPSLLIGLVAGLLNFDLMGMLRGLASHWQDILLAILAVAFTPAKILGKVGELLARIPLVGSLLKWAFEHFASFSKGLVRMVGDALGFLGRAFLEGFQRVFPGIGEGFGAALRILPTRLGLIALEVQERIGRMIIGMAETVARFIGRVVAAIGELIARMIRPFLNADIWLVNHGIGFIRGLLSGVATGARAIAGAIAGHIASMIRPFLTAGSWLLSHGSQFIGGLLQGAATGARGILKAMLGHIKTLTDPFLRAGSWLRDAGSKVIEGLLQGARDGLRAVGKWAEDIKNSVVGWIRQKFDMHSPSRVFMQLGSQMIGGLIKGLMSANPEKFIGKVFGSINSALSATVSKGWIALKDLSSSAMSALGSIGGTAFGITPTGTASIKGIPSSVSRWAPIAASALQAAGAPISWLPSLLNRMQRESGGNPTIANLWDINARNGDPSIGLMQVIGSTFRAYAGPFVRRGVTDPFANIYAAIKYTVARYGSGPAGWNRAGGYDRGGWLMPGYTPAWNGTNEKEAIFTQRQLAEFRSSGTNGNVTFINNGPLIGDNVDEWMVRKIDSLKRRKRI